MSDSDISQRSSGRNVARRGRRHFPSRVNLERHFRYRNQDDGSTNDPIDDNIVPFVISSQHSEFVSQTSDDHIPCSLPEIIERNSRNAKRESHCVLSHRTDRGKPLAISSNSIAQKGGRIQKPTKPKITSHVFHELVREVLESHSNIEVLPQSIFEDVIPATPEKSQHYSSKINRRTYLTKSWIHSSNEKQTKPVNVRSVETIVQRRTSKERDKDKTVDDQCSKYNSCEDICKSGHKTDEILPEQQVNQVDEVDRVVEETAKDDHISPVLNPGDITMTDTAQEVPDPVNKTKIPVKVPSAHMISSSELFQKKKVKPKSKSYTKLTKKTTVKDAKQGKKTGGNKKTSAGEKSTGKDKVKDVDKVNDATANDNLEEQPSTKRKQPLRKGRGVNKKYVVLSDDEDVVLSRPSSRLSKTSLGKTSNRNEICSVKVTTRSQSVKSNKIAEMDAMGKSLIDEFFEQNCTMNDEKQVNDPETIRKLNATSSEESDLEVMENNIKKRKILRKNNSRMNTPVKNKNIVHTTPERGLIELSVAISRSPDIESMIQSVKKSVDDVDKMMSSPEKPNRSLGRKRRLFSDKFDEFVGSDDNNVEDPKKHSPNKTVPNESAKVYQDIEEHRKQASAEKVKSTKSRTKAKNNDVLVEVPKVQVPKVSEFSKNANFSYRKCAKENKLPNIFDASTMEHYSSDQEDTSPFKKKKTTKTNKKTAARKTTKKPKTVVEKIYPLLDEKIRSASDNANVLEDEQPILNDMIVDDVHTSPKAIEHTVIMVPVDVHVPCDDVVQDVEPAVVPNVEDQIPNLKDVEVVENSGSINKEVKKSTQKSSNKSSVQQKSDRSHKTVKNSTKKKQPVVIVSETDTGDLDGSLPSLVVETSKPQENADTSLVNFDMEKLKAIGDITSTTNDVTNVNEDLDAIEIDKCGDLNENIHSIYFEQIPNEQVPVEQIEIEEIPAEQIQIEKIPDEQILIEQVPLERNIINHGVLEDNDVEMTENFAEVVNNQVSNKPDRMNVTHNNQSVNKSNSKISNKETSNNKANRKVDLNSRITAKSSNKPSIKFGNAPQSKKVTINTGVNIGYSNERQLEIITSLMDLENVRELQQGLSRSTENTIDNSANIVCSISQDDVIKNCAEKIVFKDLGNDEVMSDASESAQSIILSSCKSNRSNSSQINITESSMFEINNPQSRINDLSRQTSMFNASRFNNASMLQRISEEASSKSAHSTPKSVHSIDYSKYLTSRISPLHFSPQNAIDRSKFMHKTKDKTIGQGDASDVRRPRASPNKIASFLAQTRRNYTNPSMTRPHRPPLLQQCISVESSPGSVSASLDNEPPVRVTIAKKTSQRTSQMFLPRPDLEKKYLDLCCNIRSNMGVWETQLSTMEQQIYRFKMVMDTLKSDLPNKCCMRHKKEKNPREDSYL